MGVTTMGGTRPRCQSLAVCYLLLLLTGPGPAVAATAQMESAWAGRLGKAEGEVAKQFVSCWKNKYEKTIESLSVDQPTFTVAPSGINFAELGYLCSALANACVGFQAKRACDQARRIAEYLLTQRDLAGGKELGWGPAKPKLYGKCVPRRVAPYSAPNAWETQSALRCVVKALEAGIPIARGSRERALEVLKSWPVTRPIESGTFGGQGMAYFIKSNELQEGKLCERFYVKNTSIAMGEVAWRFGKIAGDEDMLRLGRGAMMAELWEVSDRHNLTYYGALAPEYAAHAEQGSGYTAGYRVPKANDFRAWQHLAFEAAGLHALGVRTGIGVEDEVWRIMRTFREWKPTSDCLDMLSGDAELFPWKAWKSEWKGTKLADPEKCADKASGISPTQMVYANCSLRFAGKSIYRDQCFHALEHFGDCSAQALYGMLPDDLLKRL